MPSDEELAHLRQAAFLQHVHTLLGAEQWVTLYCIDDTADTKLARYCFLIPSNRLSYVLEHRGWDVQMTASGPGCGAYWTEDGQRIATYYRWGSNDGGEPLVIFREYHGLREDEIEILEEFRLFHNLYFDSSRGVYAKFDENGDPFDVVRVKGQRVEARLREIRQFLALKDMFLVLYFVRSCFVKSEISTEVLQTLTRNVQEPRLSYQFNANLDQHRITPAYRSISHLNGRKIVGGLPKEASNFWPYNEKKAYEEFIIGADEVGQATTHTCDPDQLANYFGQNPEAPHFLTPVFFRRAVMTKYLSNPERYAVEDGHLRCANAWGLRLDNNHEEYVVVYLGDLGQSLSHSEQLYWKSYNVIPDGKMSDVAFQRGMLGEFAEPTKPDLLFKSRYESFNDGWKQKFGWSLFLELPKRDAHLLTALHIPVNDDQNESDGQVLALTKILIDSLNESELTARVPAEAGLKGIGKLKQFLESNGCIQTATIVDFLRNLQELRSTGSGHRKGKSYAKVAERYGIGTKTLPHVFRDILVEAVELLSRLTTAFFNEDNDALADHKGVDSGEKR